MDVSELRKLRASVSDQTSNFIPRYSYRNETLNDRWIAEYALPDKANGYYVEAGASNGRDGSSCYVLEHELQWTGICIEPNRNFYDTLVQNRPGSVCENVCLSDRHEEVVFVHPKGHGDAAPYLSGIKSNLRDYKWNGDEIIHRGEEETVKAVPLEHLLKKHNAPSIIDFGCFDIEGSELIAIRSFPFDEYQFSCLSFEADDWVWKEILDRLVPYGYVEVKNPFTDKTWERYCIHADLL